MEGELESREPVWLRGVGIVFGIVTQVGFLVTVYHLFFFLESGSSASHTHWVLVDTALTLQFAVSHSLLLYPGVRRWITRSFPAPWYGCLFCVVTCVCLLGLIAGWRGSGMGALWDLTGPAAWAMRGLFYGSWVALFYSLYLSGLGYQTGLTPWWYWVRRQRPPRREWSPRGAYRLFRHPIYLSFLGLIWFTPRMTWDHALLTAVWTVYIFVGSYLKDERLAFFVGRPYREYQATVPGYPLLFFGPLGRRRLHPEAASGVGGSARQLPVTTGHGSPTSSSSQVTPLKPSAGAA